MTVKELISKLLEYDMQSEVVVGTDKEHYGADGKLFQGYLFDIINVDEFSKYVEIKFNFEDMNEGE